MKELRSICTAERRTAHRLNLVNRADTAAFESGPKGKAQIGRSWQRVEESVALLSLALFDDAGAAVLGSRSLVSSRRKICVDWTERYASRESALPCAKEKTSGRGFETNPAQKQVETP